MALAPCLEEDSSCDSAALIGPQRSWATWMLGGGSEWANRGDLGVWCRAQKRIPGGLTEPSKHASARLLGFTGFTPIIIRVPLASFFSELCR